MQYVAAVYDDCVDGVIYTHSKGKSCVCWQTKSILCRNVTCKAFERKCNVWCITKLRSKRGHKAGGCLFSAITELKSVKDKLVL